MLMVALGIRTGFLPQSQDMLWSTEGAMDSKLYLGNAKGKVSVVVGHFLKSDDWQDNDQTTSNSSLE